MTQRPDRTGNHRLTWVRGCRARRGRRGRRAVPEIHGRRAVSGALAGLAVLAVRAVSGGHADLEGPANLVRCGSHARRAVR